MLLNILVLVISYIFMEFTAWFTHKYIMHGFLWSWHKDHHTPELKQSFFERNDLFFLVFAIPGICLIFMEYFITVGPLPFYIGLGISLYGLTYFLIHDVFIHQRIKHKLVSNNSYVKAIRRAHRLHHKNRDKYNGVYFGLLIPPRNVLNYVQR
jgi:beta-carotene 3-hydroxylase